VFVTRDQVNHSGNGWSGGCGVSPIGHISMLWVSLTEENMFLFEEICPCNKRMFKVLQIRVYHNVNMSPQAGLGMTGY
jgi:hypothetical protein